jgi:hypothetical protein
MNISRLKELLQPLPDSFDPNSLSDFLWEDLRSEMVELADEMRDAKRAADEAELEAAEARAAELRSRLGVAKAAPPGPRPPATVTRARSPIGEETFVDLSETDAAATDAESDDSGPANQSFRDELASLRERSVNKRRRRLEH